MCNALWDPVFCVVCFVVDYKMWLFPAHFMWCNTRLSDQSQPSLERKLIKPKPHWIAYPVKCIVKMSKDIQRLPKLKKQQQQKKTSMIFKVAVASRGQSRFG